MSEQSISRIIDHTLLKADAKKEDIQKLAEEAKVHQFASVCVNPAWVAVAHEVLKDTPEVKVCTVIGFPLGASTPEVKAFETTDAINNGAGEVDMVINIGALKGHDDALVSRDIAAVVEAARGKALTKVIIETSLLTDEEKVRACKLAVAAGADFVKTSTGFSTGGATKEDIALMRATVGPDIGVKASGGVRSAEDAQIMIAAGATRIGTSGGVAIAKGEQSQGNY
ncbi:Deoxyribose-phosphate aldolase 1 [compost metagenome]